MVSPSVSSLHQVPLPNFAVVRRGVQDTDFTITLVSDFLGFPNQRRSDFKVANGGSFAMDQAIPVRTDYTGPRGRARHGDTAVDAAAIT
jgi:hypothetical protein